MNSYLKICGFIGMVIHLSCLIVRHNGSDNGESPLSLYFVFMYMYILFRLYLPLIVIKYQPYICFTKYVYKNKPEIFAYGEF